METARSDTTRTERSGCLDRTFDATSWTQMERDMRCAILKSRVANSMSHDGAAATAALASLLSGSPLGSTCALPPRYFCNSLRMAMKVDGTADKSTDRASTMPMSSSSERRASCAASRSSFAMPKETENAKSDPSEPKAPVAAIGRGESQRTVLPSTCGDALFSATSSEVRLVSKQACVIDSLIATQQCSTLVVRQLLISPVLGNRHGGRGGKAMRQRVGRTHKHTHAGVVYGCTIGHVLNFVRMPSDRASEAIRTLRVCLQPVGRDLITCGGRDTQYLLRGFASHHVIRGQLSYLHQANRPGRIDRPYGNNNVVLGISACIYFVLTALTQCADNASAISMVSAFSVHTCNRVLSHWNSALHDGASLQSEALQAERRALQRGYTAIQHAKRYGKELGLDCCNLVRLELAYMRKAMWPPGCKLDGSTQADLMLWIDSDEFREQPKLPYHSTHRMSPTFNVPLSAISILHSQTDDSESESTCDSASSAGSSPLSGSSVASECCDDESVVALDSLQV